MCALCVGGQRPEDINNEKQAEQANTHNGREDSLFTEAEADKRSGINGSRPRSCYRTRVWLIFSFSAMCLVSASYRPLHLPLQCVATHPLVAHFIKQSWQVTCWHYSSFSPISSRQMKNFGFRHSVVDGRQAN